MLWLFSFFRIKFLPFTLQLRPVEILNLLSNGRKLNFKTEIQSPRSFPTYEQQYHDAPETIVTRISTEFDFSESRHICCHILSCSK